MVVADLDVAWDGGIVHVPAGTVVDVPPGSALEAAYGLANLVPLTAQQTMDDSVEPEEGK
jgi:hypothetical protein